MKIQLLSLLLVAACGAPPAANACEHCEHDDATATVAADAMTAVRDAETGQLRAATPAELAAMRAKAKPMAAASAARSAKTLSAAVPQPAVRAYGSGAHSAKLPSSMASYSVVKRQADGTLDSRCVQGEQAASQALREAPTAKSTPVAPAKGDLE